MELKIIEISERIRTLRDIIGLTCEEMAKATDTSSEEYYALENGASDFTFTFLYKCAEKFGVDIIELLTGEKPRLSGYTVVRGGAGLPIKREEGFEYFHLAPNFKHKLAEPFLVRAPYRESEQGQPVTVISHGGQEFDYILSGQLKFVHDGHAEVLFPGDSVFYNSKKPHGMIAVGGECCTFLAMVFKEEEHNK